MTATTPAELLDHLGWIQGLARQLVRDTASAEDVAQDACVAALRAPGRDVSRVRAWLATVVRNVARQHGRGRRARARREAAAARPEATPGTDELLQRAALQQELIRAVIQLDEPYRSAVLLRFFEGLPPRAIAARTQAPIATVHSRLSRALAQLRRALDQRCGGRAAWLVALVPFVPAPSLPSLALLGALLMNLKLSLAALVLAAAGTITWFVARGTTADTAGPAVAPLSGPGASSGGGGAGGGDVVGAAPAAGRRALIPPAPTAPPAASRPTVAVAGTVCDPAGLPQAGVEIAVRGDEAHGPRATSVAGGQFTIGLGDERVALVPVSPGLATVLAGAWEPGATIPPTVVVARALTLAGRVLDEDGAPIAGARILYDAPRDLEARLSLRLDAAQRLRPWTTSAEAGRFALERVPGIAGATLMVLADGCRPEVVPLPATDQPAMEIVLRRFRWTDGDLAGRVIDPRGAPVEGARVALGLTSVVSDRDGAFAISLRRAGSPTPLVAAKAGFLPARLPVPAGGGTKAEDWPARIELRLGPQPLTMAGRVVDQDDKPVAGALVWVADPEPLGLVGIVPIQVEYWLAGGALPRGADRPIPNADDPLRGDGINTSVQNVKEPTAGWFYAVADEAGRFVVPGLQPRDYTLRALDPATGLTVAALPAAAGSSGVTIRLVRDKVWPRVTGRVVSLAGKPLAGVTVRHGVHLFHVQSRVPGGSFDGKSVRPVTKVATDAQGRFALADVGQERSFLYLEADTIMPKSITAAELRAPIDAVIEVEARCHVEVVLADASAADSVAARDADGQGLDLALLRAGSNAFETDLPLFEGRSGVFAVSERARTLVLSRKGVVGREVPLRLDPGATTVVR